MDTETSEAILIAFAFQLTDCEDVDAVVFQLQFTKDYFGIEDSPEEKELTSALMRKAVIRCVELYPEIDEQQAQRMIWSQTVLQRT